jgi:hypothetical protein
MSTTTSDGQELSTFVDLARCTRPAEDEGELTAADAVIARQKDEQ